MALAARFVTICSTRRRSPVAARRRGGALTSSRTPRSSAIGSRPADTAFSASATENGPSSRAIVPDSSRESSRRSSTSAAIEPTIVRPRSRNSRSTSASPTRPVEDQVQVPGQAGQWRPQLVGDGRDEAAALGLGRPQPGQLPLGGQGVGHEREGHGGMPGEGGRQALGEDLGRDRLAEAEPQRHLACGLDREAGERQVRGGSGRGEPAAVSRFAGVAVSPRLHVGGAQRDRDGRPPRGRAPRATPGSRRIEPRRQRDRRVAVARAGGGHGDPTGDPRRRPRRARRRRSGRAGPAGRQGVPRRHRWPGRRGRAPAAAVRPGRCGPPAAGPLAPFHERRRRRDLGRVGGQTCRVSVIHLVPMVARVVRAGIPPNGDAAMGRRYRPRPVSRGGRCCFGPAGRGSGGRRR